ncbi:MAG TPA: IclR family transcriptional regulator C-terminal domain-containing protein [Micromonosporaceae bacterium]|nr:IclR family transcriptional regulator C-terminal domain-containing protein [Micromonosporaceae bacterium]
MPAAPTEETREPHHVQSLKRGLAVIRVFSAQTPELTLSEVARSCDLTRAAARRFLLTLVDLGYVRTDGRLFSLTPRVLELGYAFLSSLSLPQVAEPHLEELARQVRESSSLSVLDGDQIVYVARVPVSRIMTVAITVGTRFPAYPTSMGRVLLSGKRDDDIEAYLARLQIDRLTPHTVRNVEDLRSELHRVRADGYSVVDQELEEGLRSIAAPVRNGSGTIVAAVNISMHASRNSVESMRRDLLPLLRNATAEIEADLRAGGRR